jgi:saccharopine dehydrogenase-like NADP-dependent oxidoreductase
MKHILVIGAGRSAASLISYLLDNSTKEGWMINLGDINLELVNERIGSHANARGFVFDAVNEEQRQVEIEKADIVISMLPARFHLLVVKDCIRFKKHVITPSYVSEEMHALDQEAKDAGIIIMNEIGLDPGIDHMSAMKVLDEIRSNPENKLTCFESFTGGLIAPESDNNPWHYKFTWNPRNVVLAGQKGAVKFIQEGTYKYIPYHKLFTRTEIIEVEGHGKFEGYANRDSLKYRSIYGLKDIPTIFRGTLRGVGFCRAWDVFVQLGCTDDSYTIEGSENMTFRAFFNLFLAYNPFDRVELKLMHYLKIDHDNPIMEKLTWLGIFEDTIIGIPDASPAQILQYMLELKWSLEEDDKDMIVMWHKFGYQHNGIDKEINSSMVVKGDTDIQTAMAKTVGLPVAIATKMILNGTIQSRGVQLPISKQIYEPILKELELYGIAFLEKEVEPKLYEK